MQNVAHMNAAADYRSSLGQGLRSRHQRTDRGNNRAASSFQVVDSGPPAQTAPSSRAIVELQTPAA